jgi:cation:H+ antiporter
MLNYLILAGGCIYLLIGGDFLVRGALALSLKTSISPVVIGLTVVAMGTSAPELIVSLLAALNDHPGIAIGNVVGSNIANVLLVIGIPTVIYPIVAGGSEMKGQVVFMLVVSLLFIAMSMNGVIGRIDGIILVGILCVGIGLTLRGHFNLPALDQAEAEEQLERGIGLPEKPVSIAALIILGTIFLPVGADLAVDGAVNVADSLGVSEAAIASTLIALGTSLPELSSTLIAAFRRNADMALGNVIGSNILNILAIMGITAVIVDVPVPDIYLTRELWIMFAASLLLAGFVYLRRPIGRVSGVLFFGAYIVYCFVVL